MPSAGTKRSFSAAEEEDQQFVGRRRTSAGSGANGAGSSPRRPRRVYEASFKLQVVREALKLPASNRIKPTCRMYPGVEPVQVRKWIKNLAALQQAQPTAKLVQKVPRALPSPPPDLAGESSETESVSSSPYPHPCSPSYTQLPSPSYETQPLHPFPIANANRGYLPFSAAPTRVLTPLSVAEEHGAAPGYSAAESETLRVAHELLSLSSSFA